LNFFPVPLQKPRCDAACPQPETGAARAPLPGQAEAPQPIRLGLPPSCRVRISPLRSRATGLTPGVPTRWVLPVQAGCDPEPTPGQRSGAWGSPVSHKPGHAFAQACASPFPWGSRHARAGLPFLLAGWGLLLSFRQMRQMRLEAERGLPPLPLQSRSLQPGQPCSRRCARAKP